MTNKTLHIAGSLHEYLLDISPTETPIQRRLREETARLPQAGMQTAPEQAHFMALLARLIKARNTLELGVFTGYSTLAVALALPPDGKVVACDTNEQWTSIGRRYWQEAGVAHKIDLRIRPALETLDILEQEGALDSFDLAFIDADKQNYAAYYEKCLRLVRPGGLIMIDNVLWSGRVADPQNQEPGTRAIRAFNAKLKDDPRIWLSVVPIADGLTLAVRQPD